jgi:hypothetical protein
MAARSGDPADCTAYHWTRQEEARAMAQKEGKTGAKAGAARKRPATGTKQAKSTRAASKAKPRKRTTAAKAESATEATAINRRITWDDRQRMIAETAYYRAERRGFSGGDTVHDWLAAEAEVDARLQRAG